MSVQETKRYFESLQSEGVAVTDLVVNRVEETHGDCTFCRARVASQQPWLKELKKSFKGIRQHEVPLQQNEVRGVDSLLLFGRQIWEERSSKAAARVSSKQRSPTKIEPAVTSKFAFDERRISIFGGKGGVGKTTAAAAYALLLAKTHSKQKVLLFSSDPAHSLSDSFDEQIGALKKGIGGVRNLEAMEIDPGKWFEDLKQRYRSWTDELFGSLASGSSLEIKFDRQAMRELVELTPPGIDEIAALGAISDLVDENQYHSIVLDTAPTGHLIRFLELPQIALSWVRTFIKLLLKYQHIVHATQVAEELIELSKRIKRVLALLTDSTLCEFVGVAIPERMSLEETIDLRDTRIPTTIAVPMRKLLVNGNCPDRRLYLSLLRFKKKRAGPLVLKSFRKQFGGSVELFVAPTTKPGFIRRRRFRTVTETHPSLAQVRRDPKDRAREVAEKLSRSKECR